MSEKKQESDLEEKIVFPVKNEDEKSNSLNDQNGLNLDEMPPEIYVPIKDAQKKPIFSLYHENKELRKTVLPLFNKLVNAKYQNRITKNVFKSTI